jgi:hypothetical protein
VHLNTGKYLTNQMLRQVRARLFPDLVLLLANMVKHPANRVCGLVGDNPDQVRRILIDTFVQVEHHDDHRVSAVGDEVRLRDSIDQGLRPQGDVVVLQDFLETLAVKAQFHLCGEVPAIDVIVAPVFLTQNSVPPVSMLSKYFFASLVNRTPS